MDYESFDAHLVYRSATQKSPEELSIRGAFESHEIYLRKCLIDLVVKTSPLIRKLGESATTLEAINQAGNEIISLADKTKPLPVRLISQLYSTLPISSVIDENGICVYASPDRKDAFSHAPKSNENLEELTDNETVLELSKISGVNSRACQHRPYESDKLALGKRMLGSEDYISFGSTDENGQYTPIVTLINEPHVLERGRLIYHGLDIIPPPATRVSS